MTESIATNLLQNDKKETNNSSYPSVTSQVED